MAVDAARFRPGQVYKRGKLYEFTTRSVTVRSCGPEPPRAWRKRGRGPWIEMRPAMSRRALRASIAETLDDARRDAGLADRTGQLPLALGWVERERHVGPGAVLAWLRTIKLSQRRAAACFATRQWHILQLVGRCPGASDLVASNPALAFALASNWVFRGERRVCRPLRSARALLRKQQREVAAWMGFDSPGAARTLARIPAEEVRIDMLLGLREVLQRNALRKRLAHLPRINRAVVTIVSDPLLQRCVGQTMLSELGNRSRNSARLTRRLRELVDMYGRLQPNQRSAPPVLRSIKAFDALYEELRFRMFCTFDGGAIDPQAFPEPPLPGTASIMPLSNPQLIWQEGEVQHNCAASYARRIAQSAARDDGRVPCAYLYRVLAPERATVSIVPENGRWEIEQLAASCNRPVRSVTRRAVYDWLDACNAARRAS